MRSIALEHLVADLPLWILHQQAPLRALEEHDRRDDGEGQRKEGNQQARADSEPVCDSSNSCTSAPGRPATMPAKMMSEVPLPTPRCVICSPSHIRNMVPPTSVMTVVARKNQPGSMTTAPAVLRRAFKTDCNAVGLERGQHHGEVARVLIDLLAARLAFLLQGFELRIDRASSAA